MDGNYYKVELGSIGWVVNILRDDGEDERADALLDMVAHDEKEGYYRVVSTLKEYFDFLDELWELLHDYFDIEPSINGRFIDFS